MSHQRICLDQLPAQLCDASGSIIAVRPRIEETEHNIEDLLLCLEALRASDVPHVAWDWDEKQWQPELLHDDHYPQCYLHRQTESQTGYHVVWSVPLCRRGQTPESCDGELYFQGTGRQALLFDYAFTTAPTDPKSDLPRWLDDSIRVSVAMHEGVPLRTVFASEKGNKIKVDVRLLIELAELIDELNAYLTLEKQAISVLHRRSQRLTERDLHSNE